MSGFQWPQSAISIVHEISDNGGDVHETLHFLTPFVKDALAAEYQRGQRDGYYDGWRDCSAGDWTVIDQMRRGTDEV